MSDAVYVAPGGGVVLGPNVVCDGFVASTQVRVQTHVHEDHMTGFNSSKGYQLILASAATRDLLVAEYNAELSMRANLKAVRFAEPFDHAGVRIQLYPSEHMLGAVQTLVTVSEGQRFLYSGDFGWPIPEIPSADVLVVDCTYGSPASVRNYSREQVNERLLDLIANKLREGPIHLRAHRGTLQRALQLMGEFGKIPMVGSRHLCREVEVYKRHGYGIEPLLELGTPDASAALQDGRYIRFYGKGDGSIVGVSTGTAVLLSAYMTPPYDPVMEYSSTSYRVALSGHADFNETMDYVRATKAQTVITDGSRGGHALELAVAIKAQLGIPSSVSHMEPTRLWGE